VVSLEYIVTETLWSIIEGRPCGRICVVRVRGGLTRM
jgi:hypothetical protein